MEGKDGLRKYEILEYLNIDYNQNKEIISSYLIIYDFGRTIIKNDKMIYGYYHRKSWDRKIERIG